MTRVEQAATEEQAPPDVPSYDAAAVGRVAGRVQIRRVELLGGHFSRSDDGILAARTLTDETPEVGIQVEWSFDKDRARLGCILTFGTFFETEPEPFSFFAKFRVTYEIEGDDDLADADVEQFAYWNAVFNVWPYWREYLASTVQRAELRPVTVPVMRVPRSES